jgi:hypothetical protein
MKRIKVWTGILFIAGAVLVFLPYNLLVINFNYPDILREPAGGILTQFQAGGSGLIFTWLAFAWAGLPILVGMLLLRSAWHEQGGVWLDVATVVGVLSFIVQVIGLLRWVFVVPVLAANYVDPLTTETGRETAVLIFQTIHQYGGATLGEHMGQFFTVVWTILICVVALRAGLLQSWLAWLGMATSAVYFLAQTELLATVLSNFPVVPEAGFIGSTLWLLWLIGLGVTLLQNRVAVPSHEIAVAQ